MATIVIEFGKETSKKTRKVYLRINQGTTVKRVKTGVVLNEAEFTPKTKKIKCLEKAQIIEKLKQELEESINAIETGSINKPADDAKTLAKRISSKNLENEMDFFSFADGWVKRTDIKGAKNYRCMLNTLESFVGCRKLYFPEITVRFLKDFEASLANRSRAQSLYLGAIRHLYYEAVKELNSDEVTVIKNDPFTRYTPPKQVMKKGVRSLELKDLLKIAKYQPVAGGRGELARDCFLLSFCLMGINSVDLYNAKSLEKNVLRYKRTKTKDRRSDEAYIEVKIHPYILPIVKKWLDKKSDFVFKFHSRYSDSKGFNRNLNIGLKEVGKAVDIKDLEYYQARHTFATLSRNLMRFSKSDVDEALNHVGTLGIADVYITKDFSIINDNNFKLLDKIFGDDKKDMQTLQALISNKVHPDVLP